jgi:hypothetical protein
MPAFIRFPQEGAIIGRILAGYGELELELCNCVNAVSDDFDAALKLLFRRRGEERRIKAADSVARPKFIAAGLGEPYCQAIADMNWCRTIRNQYAHCNWYDTSAEGLCFVNLEDLAKSQRPIASLGSGRRPINVTLLETQEAFLSYVRKCFWYLGAEYQAKAGKQPNQLWALPLAVAQPPLHN